MEWENNVTRLERLGKGAAPGKRPSDQRHNFRGRLFGRVAKDVERGVVGDDEQIGLRLEDLAEPGREKIVCSRVL